MSETNSNNRSDIYWDKLFNRIERAVGWFFFVTGLIILVTFVLYQFVITLIKDAQISVILKIGILSVILGFVILVFSIIREKIVLSKKDKYTEVNQ
jgi:hypothetical protein